MCVLIGLSLVSSACAADKYDSPVSILISMDYVGTDAVRNESCQHKVKYLFLLLQKYIQWVCVCVWLTCAGLQQGPGGLDGLTGGGSRSCSCRLPSHFPWQVWTKDPEKCHCSIFKSLGHRSHSGMKLPLHIMQIILTAYLILLLG